MCGRFAQIDPLSTIIKVFFIDDILTDIPPSFNITPGSKILSIVNKDARRLLVDFQWGLIPHWAKDKAIGQRLINARAESIHQKPSFRSALKSRRCLIVASGFYEWKKEGRVKIPYFIRLISKATFAFAGIYERWISADGTELPTCSIITTESNELIRSIHNRMPVILPRKREDAWLDASLEPKDVLSFLKPYPHEEMEIYPVSTRVNSPMNNTPDCIAPLAKDHLSNNT
jgi:putative SOS response-associated peptidase YedK